MVSGVFTLPLPVHKRRRQTGSPQQGRSAAAVAEFVAGPENALVRSVVQLMLRDESDSSPLLIFGPSGVGKTHLALGSAALWQQTHPARTLLITDGGGFAREFALARDAKGLADFQRRFARARLLVIDDLDGMPRHQAVQTELIGLLDRASRQRRTLLVTCRELPSPRHGILPALASRLLSGLAVPVRPPELAARTLLVNRLAAQCGVPLRDSQAEAIAAELALPVPALADEVKRLFSDAVGQRKTVDELIANTTRRPTRSGPTPSINSITTVVGRHFGVTAAELCGVSRRQAVAQARAFAMYLSRQLTGLSTATIGRFFGNRHHSTVIHACQVTRERLAADSALQQAAREIGAHLKTP
jgi:chromosomal replication initiator protein